MQALPPPPSLLTIGAQGRTVQPHVRAVAASPEIQSLRFSAPVARLGTDWDGDVVASTNTVSVEFATNLFDFSAPRTQPGRFHFRFHMIDVPNAYVRPYILHVIARNTAGAKQEIEVPFGIAGRSTADAFNADARSSEVLAAPPLVDMNGRSVDLEHGVTAIAFIYTRCADPRMCPLVTAKFARMATLLADAPVRLLEVTLDPAFDTPAVLRRYGRAVGADGTRWTLATGEPAAIDAFAVRAGLLLDRPRPGLIAHTEAVLIARDGILEQNIVGNDWTAAEVAAEARSIATLPGNPLARFALRLFGGVVQACGTTFSRGFTPAMMLGLLAGAAGAGLLIYAGRRRLWAWRNTYRPMQ